MYNLSKGFYLRTFNEMKSFRAAQWLVSFCLGLMLEEKQKRKKKKSVQLSSYTQKTHSKREFRDPGSERPN